MLTCRVLTRSILETGANSAFPPTAPRLSKLPIRPRSAPYRRHGLHSRVNRVIQGSFGCIWPHTFALSAPSFSRIFERTCALKTSTVHNPFGINESRTLGVFTTNCASANSFAIKSFRTLLQKPGGSVLPLACRSRRTCGGRSSRPKPSVIHSGAVDTPLWSRWSPVVFSRKTPSISFLFMPLRDTFPNNEGAHTPLPPADLAACH